jgi:predicted metalloprotease
MRWRDGRGGEKVQDAGGGPRRTGLKLALVGLLAIGAAWFLGVDPRIILGLADAPDQSGPPAVVAPAPTPTSAPRDEIGDFISVVLADTEDTWTQIFAEQGETYIPPRLRYFEGSTRSGCNTGSAESGPFYCAADRRVYIDLNFYRELADRFHAPGDFAQAYVIAHEVGHHVQNLMGIDRKLRKLQAGKGVKQRNALQLRVELQADCFAGIWAHNAEHARQQLAPGDLEKALSAAASVGDDIIQRRAQDEVVPDPFTHGTAAQRQRWFESGLKRGLVKDCDTYAARKL